MREAASVSALSVPDWGKRCDCRPAALCRDKDEPFEPEGSGQLACAPGANGQSKAKERRGRLRVSAIGFLAALVLMLVASPFVEGLKEGQLYGSVLFTLVMCTGLIATGSCRRLAFGLVSLPLAAIWLNQVWPQKCPAFTFILPAIAFLAVVIASLLGFILRAKKVDANVLCAGISIYLILGLVWSLAYTFVAQLSPNAFSFNTRLGTTSVMSGFTAIYFSFTTLMTVGYGDITPVADVARMLAIVEAMAGTLFVGVMIARLVSLYSATGHNHIPARSENNKQSPDL